MFLRVFAAAAALCVAAPALAQNVESFIVANDDGYGVDTCLESGASCGQPVANAWCQANGFSLAVNFRKAGATDTTGSIDKPQEVASVAAPHAVIITCQK